MDETRFDTLCSRDETRLSVSGLQSELAGPFSFDLAAGACLAVTGPSGSGKSLMLRVIADLDPNTGEVAVAGRPRASLTPSQWRRRVVYVAAEAGWWADTVVAHFDVALLPRLRSLAAELGLSADLVNGPVMRLSTGEKQRLALLRALVLEPAVLLLDEPTAALDPQSTSRVEALLRQAMSKGLAMVLVTHDIGLAERIGTIRLRMADRRLVAS